MKSFVLTYVRSTGELSVESYEGPTRRSDAFQRRMQLERQVGAGTEVVVLQAESEDALMRTHARYYRSAKDLLQPMHSPSTAAS